MAGNSRLNNVTDMDTRFLSYEEIARRIQKKLAHTKHESLILDCHSEALDDIIRIYDVLKDLNINAKIKTEQGILSLYDIKEAVRKLDEVRLVAFHKYFDKVQGYNTAVMSGLKATIKRQDNVSMSEHLYLELVLKWASDARPTNEDLHKVFQKLDFKHLCWRMVCDVSLYLRHLYRYTPLTHPSIDSDVWGFVDQYWLKQSDDDTNTLLESGSLKIRSLDNCKIKSCKNGTPACYKVELRDNRYTIRDCLESECDEESEHTHVNSVLHYWMEYYDEENFISLYYVSLLTAPKDIVNNVIISHATNLWFYVVIDPLHVDLADNDE